MTVQSIVKTPKSKPSRLPKPHPLTLKNKTKTIIFSSCSQLFSDIIAIVERRRKTIDYWCFFSSLIDKDSSFYPYKLWLEKHTYRPFQPSLRKKKQNLKKQEKVDNSFGIFPVQPPRRTRQPIVRVMTDIYHSFYLLFPVLPPFRIKKQINSSMS